MSRYTAPVPKDPNADDDKIEATNYENSALFLLSCFQYILVAAVFSIGPPYRKPMWTNGQYFSERPCGSEELTSIGQASSCYR